VADRQATVPVEVILQALRSRLERQSLRALAREVGVTHRGLGKILHGSQPREATIVKLESWYEGYCETEPGAARTVEALKAMFEGISTGEREEAAEGLRKLLREMTGS
jgi:predicted transcriptional regulator